MVVEVVVEDVVLLVVKVKLDVEAMVLVMKTIELMAEDVVLSVDKVVLEVVMAKDEFLMSITGDMVVMGVEVVIAVDVLVVRVDVVLLLMIGVVVVPLGATVVCIRQRFSTTTASIGQHEELPHFIDNSADNFVHMPALGAAFTMSYL